VTAASREARQQAYAWLQKTRHTAAQDQRIRSLQELDAFARIQQAWQRLGYPFDTLTPSYATAIGASGDRPAALAELMGIIANQGLRRPAPGLLSLAFARRTPYETRLEARPQPARRVLPEEIARIVRRSLADVVEDGTARRLKDALVLSDGRVLPVGGKTGTGDHRFEVYGRGGRLISSRVVDRTATFVFVIGERWFGTVMIYAHEPDAAGFRFTSALPAQLLKALWPALRSMVEGAGCGSGGGEAPPGVLAAGAGFVPAASTRQDGSSTGSGSDLRRDAVLPNTWSQKGLVTP
jgi:membrane peptidoglycan carboxypeptidase